MKGENKFYPKTRIFVKMLNVHEAIIRYTLFKDKGNFWVTQSKSMSTETYWSQVLTNDFTNRVRFPLNYCNYPTTTICADASKKCTIVFFLY